MSQGKLSPTWRSRFLTLTVFCKRNGAPGREDALEMSMSCCVYEPMETAQCLGDDTHAVIARPKWAREHGLRTDVWSSASVGGKLGPSTSA